MNPIGDLLHRVRRWLGNAGATAPPASSTGATAPGAAGPGEIAWADGLFFGSVPFERWNPDDLLARRGHGIYRKMLHDDQIRALLALKGACIAARGWRFEAEAGSPAQRECAQFLRFLLEKALVGPFSQVLQQMLTAQAFGFSIVEKVYAPLLWRGRACWGVRQLKLRPAETFSFETDAFGNLTGLIQQQGSRRAALPPERFIRFVNKPDVHAQYGESDLRECYRAWFAKENILKFWNIYLERMAAGFVHGRISGPLTPAEREELRRVMGGLSSQTSVITPANVELKMVSAPSTDAFERAVAAHDRAMAKALLVPNLLGFSEQGQVGSYSQSRTQLEAFFFVLNGLAEALADTLNEQLFRELAFWNFGLDDPPLFAFDPLSEGQKRELAAAWGAAVGAGIVSHGPADEARTRDLLRYPPLAASHSPSGEGAGG